jgi:hypothetical protein
VKLTGKTILPLRTFKHLLQREGAFDRLLELEIELSKDPTAAAKASHLQVVARKCNREGAKIAKTDAKEFKNELDRRDAESAETDAEE